LTLSPLTVYWFYLYFLLPFWMITMELSWWLLLMLYTNLTSMTNYWIDHTVLALVYFTLLIMSHHSSRTSWHRVDYWFTDWRDKDCLHLGYSNTVRLIHLIWHQISWVSCWLHFTACLQTFDCYSKLNSWICSTH
jgi:hypothetical protein